MKIDSSYKPSTPPVASRPQTRPADNSQTAASVSLSALAETIQGSEKPPVNSARIQEIKDAISQGRFKINPEAIADSLIQSARDLSGNQQKA